MHWRTRRGSTAVRFPFSGEDLTERFICMGWPDKELSKGARPSRRESRVPNIAVEFSE